MEKLMKEISELRAPLNSRPEMVEFIAWVKAEMLKHVVAPARCPEATAFWKTLEVALHEEKCAGLEARLVPLTL
jgi:hypothetical protein